MNLSQFDLGLPKDSPLLLPKGAPAEVNMLDNMEACDEADEDAMDFSQQPSLGREDRSRTRGHDARGESAQARFARPEPCNRQQQQQQQQQQRHSAHSTPTTSNPSMGLSAEEGKEAATQGSGTAKSSDIASAKEGAASTEVDALKNNGTAGASKLKDRKNPIKNLQSEFLSAILESDDQLDYHTDALLGYYDTDSDKRLMIVDLKDILPSFYGQLGCDQPESLELLDLFASSDLDRDGSLDRDEFKHFLRAMLKQGQEIHEMSQL
mmetsp:Transcript_124884/g.249375  ORF Transcript_124884/g.249375 Transcript_124884/m.249375 type:complete len:266 (+) Transcript_124884:81-878(+)